MYNSIISDMLGNLMELVDSYLKPSNTEKKMLGEVFTSLKLVEEMLDKLPVEVWSNPHLKFLDPANGMGNFPVILVKKLMKGLEEWQPDPELRLKHILENQIYVCELQSKNMFIYLQLFDSENKYKLNFHRGSFLDEGFDDVMNEEWGVRKFDLIVGNPPYQDSPKSKISKTSGSVLWDKFVNKSITILSNLGYLVFVHPSIWRKPINSKTKIIDILSIFKKFNLIYLEIHDVKDGMKTFNAGTRYDFYCFQKSEKYNSTIIKDQLGNIINIDIRNINFIPNKEIDKVMSLIGPDRITVIFDSSYHASREYISNVKDKKNIYEVIHSTPKSGPRILYSSLNNKGHFGIPKVIFGEAGINNVIIDINGDYGMTQGAIGLVIEADDDPILMKKVIESKEFGDIINSCMWSNFRIDAKLFMLFKKRWYRDIKISK